MKKSNHNNNTRPKKSLFRKPLHKIFEKEVCLSPLPTLALHVTNVNSAYGISPFVDAEALWAHCE